MFTLNDENFHSNWGTTYRNRDYLLWAVKNLDKIKLKKKSILVH